MLKLILAIVVIAYPVCAVAGIEVSEIALGLTGLFDAFVYFWLAPRS